MARLGLEAVEGNYSFQCFRIAAATTAASECVVNLRSVLLEKKLHVFATKTCYLHGFRYNFSNPISLFVKKYSIVGNKFLVIDPQKLFALAQMVLGRVNFALINPQFCVDKFLTDTR